MRMALFDRLFYLIGRLGEKSYMVPTPDRGWQSIIREANTGNWQRNIEVNRNTAALFYADFSCKTLIARDIAKLPICLKQKDKHGVWTEVVNAAFSPVLRKPNTYQTRNQFWEHWMLSKLSAGNTFALKLRDARKVVVALHVLDPRRVTPLVAKDGSVFYQLDSSELHDLPETVTVPASEIIHDRMNCIVHPLVGVPPIFASALAATQGLNIQHQSIRLFANNATPGGILTAPGTIEDETAERIKKDWNDKFGGGNIGSLAVLGDGLKFEKMSLTAVEGQMLEQLKWSAENVCSTYHVPPYKIGVGAMPSYNNVQALNVEYYGQCLQSLIEDAESCLDEGLGLGEQYSLGVEFDIDNLLRMDTTALADATNKLVAGSILTPNEGRLRFNQKPLPGGDTVYMQQQNYSLEALAKRDAQDDPFKIKPAAQPAPASELEGDAEPEDADEMTEVDKQLVALLIEKNLDARFARSAQ
jgi:HK97 family phage portal protein